MQKVTKLDWIIDQTASEQPSALAIAPAMKTGLRPKLRMRYEAGTVESNEPKAKHDKGKVAQLRSGAMVKPTMPAVAKRMIVTQE